jgi:small subunit ribosomal protein S2
MTENAMVKELLEAGAHFGHLTSVWHPKMKDYIFTQRNGIHIIDLEKTAALLEQACAFVRELIAIGQTILFVGTKKQVQQIIEEEASRCDMCYVNQRWIGGLLTNFDTIQSRINYLVDLEDRQIKGELEHLSKKERTKIEKEISRLNIKIGGFKEMNALPGALFIVDIIKDKIALSEAKKLDIPVVAIVDTNCNPEEVDYPIPANDDAVKTLKLICSRIADAVLEGKQVREQEQLEMVSVEGQEMEEGVELLASYSFSPDEEQPAESPEQPLEEQAGERPEEQPSEEQAGEQPHENPD